MARPKSSKKRKGTAGRRRGRMGAVSSNLTNVLAAIAGGAVAQVVGNVVAKALPASTSMRTADLVKAGVPVAVGFFLPRFVKSDFGKYAGVGMMTVGGLRLVQSFGVLNGIPGMDNAFVDRPMLANVPGQRLPEPMPGYNAPMLAGMLS